MSAASEQDPNLLTPSHPNEASPGRNDIVVATMHYGHKRMIFEKDVAIQVRDGTVWLKHQRALKLEPGEIVPVDIEIWPSSTLFRKGEALQLTVQGGGFQLHQIKPATGPARTHPGEPCAHGESRPAHTPYWRPLRLPSAGTGDPAGQLIEPRHPNVRPGRTGPLYCTAITIFPKCPPVAWCA